MKKIIAILLALTMVVAMSVPALAEGESKPGVIDGMIPIAGEPTTALITDGEGANNFHEADVNVTYMGDTGANLAEKTYFVKLEYVLPSLVYSGKTTYYTWDAANKKYVLAEEKKDDEEPKTKGEDDEASAYQLNDGGNFMITLENRSNVLVDYEITYTADEQSDFTSELAEIFDDTGSIDTVASSDYQQVVGGSVMISDTAKALAGEGEKAYPVALCKGALSVDLKQDKSLTVSQSYKLGTFRVVIMEHADEFATLTLAKALSAAFPKTDEAIGSIPSASCRWGSNDNCSHCYVDDNGLNFIHANSEDATGTDFCEAFFLDLEKTELTEEAPGLYTCTAEYEGLEKTMVTVKITFAVNKSLIDSGEIPTQSITIECVSGSTKLACTYSADAGKK